MTESQTQTSSPAKLARSRDDRYVGGVCAGIATRLNIDPIIIRLIFVASLIFGGIGAVVYLALLIILPVEGDPNEPVPTLPERRRNLVIGGMIVLGIVVIATRGSGWIFGFGPGTIYGLVFWAFAIVGIVWLIRQVRGTNDSGPATDQPTWNPPASKMNPTPAQAAPTAVLPTDPPTATTLTSMAPVQPPAGSTPPSQPYPGQPGQPPQAGQPPQPGQPGQPPQRVESTFGKVVMWGAIGVAIMIGLFVLGCLSLWTTLVSGAIPMAVVIVALGVAMVVLAITGRSTIAAWLIPAVIVVAIPMAFLSFTGIRLHGTWGDVESTPVTTADFPSDGYQLAGGKMTIDMRGFDFTDGETTDLPVESGLGYTLVIVPDDVCVTGDFKGKAGLADIRGTEASGVNFTKSIEADQNANPGVRLDSKQQIGFVQVIDATAYESDNYLGTDKYDYNDNRDFYDQIDRQAIARATQACDPTPPPKVVPPSSKLPRSAGQTTKA